MIELNEEIKVSNYATYKRYLNNLVGEPVADQIVNSVGGEEALMNASFGMSEDSNTAFDGALIKFSLEIAEYAKRLNGLLPEEKRVTNASIYRVALLQHLAKAVMYSKNDNEWEVEKRGIYYKFNELGASLRCGERSLLLSMTAGVKFTEEEYEAMRVVDKVNEGDNAVRWYGTVLSMLIRQANEIVTLIEKK